MAEAAAVDQGVDLEVLLNTICPYRCEIIPVQVVSEALEVEDDFTSHNQTLNNNTVSIIADIVSATTTFLFK